MRAYIGVGSNLGDRRANIEAALRMVGRLPETCLLQVSPLYETEPVGGPLQGKYLNGALVVETRLEPEELLGALLSIERELGRERNERHGPRTIDLDILLCGQLVLRSERLEIPHPRMTQRLFVLAPLSDIAPDELHPVLGRTVKDLLEDIAPGDM